MPPWCRQRFSALFGSSYRMVAGPHQRGRDTAIREPYALAPTGSPDYIRLVLTVTLLTGVSSS